MSNLPTPAADGGSRESLVFTAAHVVTLAEVGPPNATAVVVCGDRIEFVGDVAAALRQAGPGARRVDFPGATIMPGFVDTHAHLTGLGMALCAIHLGGCTSAEEAVARLRAQVPPGDGPVEGLGWDQNDWPGGAFPTHAPLTTAFPDRVVVLRRVDGHALWVNAHALGLAGVTAETPEAAGGRILRGSDGAPTGVLLDAAMSLVTSRLPPADPERLRGWLRRAVAACHSVGLTGVHDAGTSAVQLAAMRSLEAEGALELRVHVLLDASDPETAGLRALGPIDGDRIAVRGVKIFCDGALGSRGAWLTEPYTDAPDGNGIAIVHGASLRTQVAEAAAAGFQVAVYAIGDAAARDVVDAFSAVLSEGNDRRFRVEHAQIVRPEDRRRMARLGVLGMVQPTHATGDMPWAEQRLGAERLSWAYAWRSLLNDGVRLALGSDFPVERPEPVAGLAAAVTRQNERGEPAGGWRAEERLTAREALEGFTTWAAYAGFAEARRGRLEPGFDADLTVLSGDPLTTAPERLGALRVVATVVAGRLVHRADV